MAGGAGRCAAALAVAARAGEAELHRARHLRDVAGAVALRAGGRSAPPPAAAVAGLADFLAGDVERTCVPRMACQKSMFRPYSRSAPFSGPPRLFAPRPPKNWLKMSRNARRSARLPPPRRTRRPAPPRLLIRVKSEKSKPPKPMLADPRAPAPRPGPPGGNVVGIETVLIVHLALLGIAQDVVGFLNLLEALLGGFVAGIQIGMILARQLAVSLADLVFFGVPRARPAFRNNRVCLRGMA
jgi:hypothetical protein